MTPYTSGPHFLAVVGGEEQFIELRCPPRGAIVTLRFDQVDGAAENCVFELYSNADVLPSGASSSSSSVASATLESPRTAYSIFGAKTFTASTPLLETDKNYAYQNTDNTPSQRRRRLYARVVPAGTGDKTYVLTMEIDLAVT